MKKKDLRSVIQPDFDECVLRGHWPVHHVFPGVRNRRKCEKYGFLVCIPPWLHDEIHRHGDRPPALDLKRMCQKYWELHIGDREGFVKEFGRNYL